MTQIQKVANIQESVVTRVDGLSKTKFVITKSILVM